MFLISLFIICSYIHASNELSSCNRELATACLASQAWYIHYLTPETQYFIAFD